jgi:hypothetical protein
MVYQRIHKSSSWNSKNQEKSSQFAPRLFTVQAKQNPHRAPTQEAIENEAFNQNKFEAFGLQLKEKHGTITPMEQKKLGVLQAKMDSFSTQRIAQSKTGPNLLGILTRNSQATQTTESQTSAQSKTIQAKSDTMGDRPDSPIEQRPNKTGMPDALKAGVENLSGYALDDVRVHYNSPKPAQLKALAYTQGPEIYVASGQEKHLPHEAWHVVQQMQGRVQPTMQMKNGVPINDDAGLEREADVMGAKATQKAGTVGEQNTRPSPVIPRGNVTQRLVVKYGDSSPIPEDAKKIADSQNLIRGREIGVRNIPGVVPDAVQYAMGARGEKIYIVAHGCAPLGSEPAVLQDENGGRLTGSDVAGFIASLKTGLAAKGKWMGPVKIEACMSSLSRKTKRALGGETFVKAKPSLVKDIMTSLADTYKVSNIAVQGNKGFSAGTEFEEGGITNLSPKNTELGLLAAVLDTLYVVSKEDWNTKANKSLRNDGINIIKRYGVALADFDDAKQIVKSVGEKTAILVKSYLTSNVKPNGFDIKRNIGNVIGLLNSYVRDNPD